MVSYDADRKMVNSFLTLSVNGAEMKLRVLQDYSQVHVLSRTSYSLIEDLPIKMTRKKKSKKLIIFQFIPRIIRKNASHWTSTDLEIWVDNSAFVIPTKYRKWKTFFEVLPPPPT